MGALTQEIALAIGIMLPAALAGLVLGRMWPLIAIAFALYGARHLYHLIDVSIWLHHGTGPRASRPVGLWGRLYDAIRRIQANNLRHKRRLDKYLKRFARAASALPDGIAILDRQGRVEWGNAAACRLLGIRWPQHARKPLVRFVDDPVLRERLGLDMLTKPIVLPSPTDQTRLLSLEIVPFEKNARRMLIARNVTREYYLDRSRRDFVANASHELRTPLTVLRGALEALLESDRDDALRSRSAQLIEQQAGRLQAIVEDLLTLSRLDIAEDETATRNAVDVPALLKSVIQEARVLSGPDEHELHISADERLWIYGDEAVLRSAFSNLVFNAVRHTPPRTRIEVRWSAPEAAALLSVKDTGEGIPARHIPRLTERFYRVEGIRKKGAGGTGLGLAIVKHALARHDGTLSISSQIGQGSRFSCQFPADRTLHREADDE